MCPFPLLTLALLVLRVDANHAHDPAPVNHLALIANLFYRCPDFHIASPNPLLLIAVNNATASQIVRRKLYGHLVTRQYAYKVFAHLS
jgi:hypothetical protein